MTETIKTELLKAIALAQHNEWDAAHRIAQEYNNAPACWIHAVLHKIEGDEDNSRYWYARCNVNYEDFKNLNDEFNAIIKSLGA
jgi:hypothetical protein